MPHWSKTPSSFLLNKLLKRTFLASETSRFLGTVKRKCAQSGKPGTCPLIFLSLPVTVLPQLLPNQKNKLCLDLLQVGAHGPRHVQ